MAASEMSLPETSRLAREAIFYALEITFLLAVMCLMAPRALATGSKIRLGWKVIAFLLAVISGMYVMFVPLVRVARMLEFMR